MKKSLAIISALALLASIPAEAKSPKRGVSENQFQYLAQMQALEPGVSWYYNWANTPGRNIADFSGMEFIPMCWNGNYNADGIREYVKSHPEVKYLLGFNEPNFTAQANLTPAAAAELWGPVRELARELGLKLVAPALNYSPNAPYQDPLKWMDEFVALVGADAFDYLAIHSYGGFDVMKTLATNFHNKYGKDVWVTEFCYWPNEGDQNSLVTPESQIGSMMQAVEWLEKTDWIFRYSWFKPIGNSSASKGPNYGLLISGKGEEPRELSAQGQVYVNMPDFEPDACHQVDETVSAADYMTQSSCLLGPGANPENPKSIEFTRFNAGASADYRFDVGQDGEYMLILSVSGQGEPVRFDPCIAIYSVSDDGTETELAPAQKFTLPGSDEIYNNVYFRMSLPGGRQTIRIKDMGPYQPSGIHIATLLLTDAAAIDELHASDPRHDNRVYDLMGRRVDNPRRGIYIRNRQVTKLF